jgi:hypothetical protein
VKVNGRQRSRLRRIGTWVLLLLVVSVIALYLHEWRMGQRPRPSASPNRPSPAPENVPSLAGAMREQLIIAGALSAVDSWVDGLPIELGENLQADDPEPADQGAVDFTIDRNALPTLSASNTLAAIAMLAVNGGLSGSIGPSSIGTATGSGGHAVGGDLVGGSFIPDPEHSLDAPPQIAEGDVRGAADPPLGGIREIVDRSNDFPTAEIPDEDDSETDVSPLGEVPLFGVAGLQVDESGLQSSTLVPFDTTLPVEDSTPVPEPGTLLLIFTALSTFGARRGFAR